MAINGCQKGKAGEREFAEFLRGFGVEARRGQQFSGGTDSPDVVHNLGKFHFEVKRVENLNVYKALEQAIRDGGATQVPVVAHRRNRTPWTVSMRASDLMVILQKLRELEKKVVFGD